MFDVHIDRAISVYLCHPFSRRLDGWRKPRIPILMYHSIGEGTQGFPPRPSTWPQRSWFLPRNSHYDLTTDGGQVWITLPFAKKIRTIGGTLGRLIEGGQWRPQPILLGPTGKIACKSGEIVPRSPC
jgi:hypothetical protein